MATRVLLTGASGLLGTWLRRTVPDDVALTCLVHRSPVAGPTVAADLRDPVATRAAVAEAAPDLVLHAAYAVDEASIATATANVASAAAAIGAEVVLVSTDVVFDGDGIRRDEDDAPDPVSDYGRWKAASEATVAASSTTACWVRLPLVVSTDPDDGAVARIRSAAAEGEATTWFDDELRQPAMADELAAALWRIVALPARERAGAWHLMGSERLTRLEIGRLVAEAIGVDVDLLRGEPTPPGLARPRDLHLGDARARSEIGWSPRPIFTAPRRR